MAFENLYDLWHGAKSFLRMSGTVDPDVAHIHLGLAGFFVFYTVFRKTKQPAACALVCVFLLQLTNEIIDILLDLQKTGSARLFDSFEDFASTLFWPIVLFIFLFILDKNRKPNTD